MLIKIINKAIREKRRNHDKSGEGNLKNRLQEEGGTKFQTVLEFLLEIDRREKYFSEEDLTSEIKTLIIGVRGTKIKKFDFFKFPVNFSLGKWHSKHNLIFRIGHVGNASRNSSRCKIILM